MYCCFMSQVIEEVDPTEDTLIIITVEEEGGSMIGGTVKDHLIMRGHIGGTITETQ